jgi:DNA polymerase I-like protein with 3'-5' exonuclease and polymerase domains
VKPLLQVHDSVVFQYHVREHPHIMKQVEELMAVEIPYDDPLIILVGFKSSKQSWGDAE